LCAIGRQVREEPVAGKKPACDHMNQAIAGAAFVT
jgi:hypothetical protein